MSRFVVTGCAGFIGSHLTDALLDAGHDVLGIDAFTDYYPRRAKEANLATARGRTGFSLVEADLAEVPLTPLLADVSGVFHLAAQAGVRGSWGTAFPRYVRDNLLATQRLFEEASRAGVRVVFASSSSIYGDAEAYPTPENAVARPRSPYGVTKLGCEHLAQTYSASFDLDVVGLRYFSVYGPWQRPDMAFARIIAAALASKPFRVHGSGEQSRDFTYVSDAVAATMASMDGAPGGAVYNVGGGDEVTLREAIGLCERLSRRRIDVDYGPPAPGDVRRTAADTTRIRAELGWAPRTSIREGLAAQIERAATLST